MSSAQSYPPTTAVIEATRLLSLLNRYSIELTDAVGTVPGVDEPGNGETLALVELFRSGPISSNDLAERSGLSRRDTNRLVKTLDTHGLIERVPSESDRRVLLVGLTPAGRRQRTKFVRSLTTFFDRTTELAATIADDFGVADDVEDRPPLDLSTSLSAAAAVAGAGVAISDALDDGDGSPRRRSAMALILIGTGEVQRPSELAERLGYTSGGMAHVLDDLERSGHIERRYGTLADDRRASVVSLTDDGSRWVAKTCDAVVEAAPSVAPVFAALAARV